MDAVLERILSLIPKKENGDYKRGAKKAFCDAIDVPQQTLSDWIAERSTTYTNKLHEIADANHVSFSWLKYGKDEDDIFNDDRKQWLEEQEALQILRDNPNTRTLLFAGKNLKSEQINQFARLMESITEG